MKNLFIATLLFLISFQLPAGVVFAHSPDPVGGLIKSAYPPPDGLDGDNYFCYSFILSATQAITEISGVGTPTVFPAGQKSRLGIHYQDLMVRGWSVPSLL